MSVGVIGLGRLGLPVALTFALRGHRVLGYDTDPARMRLGALSPHERGPDGSGRLADHTDRNLPLRFTTPHEIAQVADCVFVIVETPHGALYDGVTPLPESRADFSYHALTRAVEGIASCAGPGREIGVMSTVLPGTMRSRVLPLAARDTLVYCPQFVGMGTVAHDLLNPEFTLIGRDASDPVVIPQVLSSLAEAPTFTVSYETAELAKVIYNTFVSAKVTLSNEIQRMASETGASSSDVFQIIRAADHRLASAAYIGPGMGDGGPCHPRDNIALSWLARRIGMGADLFTAVMEARQGYTEWLGEQFITLAPGLPLVLLGTAFKPGTDLESGSSALLLTNLLRLRGTQLTVVRGPHELTPDVIPSGPGGFFLGCPEPEFIDYDFPTGSVVVDPWHRVPPREGVTVVHLGEVPPAEIR
jgi:UDPglucose 6-dehydrogenase